MAKKVTAIRGIPIKNYYRELQRKRRRERPEIYQRDIRKNRERAKLLRKITIEMLGRKCANCEFGRYKSALEKHHIDGNPKNEDFENLILLCANCHRALEHGEIPIERIISLKKKERIKIPVSSDSRRHRKPLKKRPMWMKLRPFLDNIIENLPLEYCGGRDEIQFEQRSNNFYLRVTFKAPKELTGLEWNTFKERMEKEFESERGSYFTRPSHDILMLSPFPENSKEFIIKFQFF